MIRTASPGPTARVATPPAATSPTTGSRTAEPGTSGSAADTSTARTAYPSIAELSKPGRSTSEVTSSQRTSPRHSGSGSRTGSAGVTAARMASRCSSRLRTSAGPVEHVTPVSRRPSWTVAGVEALRVTSPMHTTSAPKVTSPSTRSAVASRSEGAPRGNRCSNPGTSL